LRELLTLADHNRHPTDPDRLTVAQWLDRWLGVVKTELAAQTHASYETAVRVHIIPAIGDKLLSRLSPNRRSGLLFRAGRWADAGQHRDPHLHDLGRSAQSRRRAAVDRDQPGDAYAEAPQNPDRGGRAIDARSPAMRDAAGRGARQQDGGALLLKTYAHVTDAVARNAALRLGDLFAKL
jgi:hypothetical protein